jgi:hypothetical protein
MKILLDEACHLCAYTLFNLALSIVCQFHPFVCSKNSNEVN